MRKNKTVPNKEVDMTSIADVSVRIQTGSRVCPLDAFLVRGGCADHPLSTPRKASFLPSAHRCAWLATVSGTTRVRHEDVPMSVSTAKVVTRPAVSPAVSYQDMRSR